jgi:hypothetical protein
MTTCTASAGSVPGIDPMPVPLPGSQGNPRSPLVAAVFSVTLPSLGPDPDSPGEYSAAERSLRGDRLSRCGPARPGGPALSVTCPQGSGGPQGFAGSGPQGPARH